MKRNKTNFTVTMPVILATWVADWEDHGSRQILGKKLVRLHPNQ
jgi:hypothetical protein